MNKKTQKRAFFINYVSSLGSHTYTSKKVLKKRKEKAKASSKTLSMKQPRWWRFFATQHSLNSLFYLRRRKTQQKRGNHVQLRNPDKKKQLKQEKVTL